MNSKDIHHLTTTIFCILMFIHYASSQTFLVPAYEDDDSIVDNSLSIKHSSDSKMNNDLLPKLLLALNEYNRINQPKSTQPMRRANFWKRANFWRKRANFW